mmetsp:Transcript_18742/g.44198  ORF Transcript_18742/g.44198 Transcript_18742/m.44198 type:complete len:751 (+) Transcript_18742:108-2360(+)|eukprot:CAMPEP_0168749962 /NCGR_PEP_ID=MMETSP0724-20121128/17005_1 /TAXON_ID=265536 /ORGANISM="Amphiprora sp., Strain CCMP467" /LENGTH=750 /DNA_ID=CAMNT_0008797925 /DNA_START=20 /DNA_END=2272 /DNA_ORIENTATION=-
MGAKKKSGGGGNQDETKREQPLQAVLLADSFVNTFRPLSLDRPKMLCPLNNVTLLDYAFDFLAGAGVEEVFVVCVSDQVESYVRDNTWSMSVSVLKDASLTNAGDALRELDRRDMVKSDPFVLLFGDVVTNVNLSGAIDAHKARHKKDRSNMMTLLFKEVGATDLTPSSLAYSSIRTNSDDLVVGLNPSQENRILVYSNTGADKSVAVPCSFFASHSQIDLRYDLLDCGIDICSPDVLARFTDEFDYREIRRKFVANSVAEEEEGLQNKIYAHLLESNEYAARIHDFTTYVAISRDLLKRWCYPVVPDNLPSSYKKHYRYELQRHYMYVEQKNGKSQVHRTSLVKGAGMIGGSCVVGKHCHIEQTVLGHNCRIRDEVSLNGCHVWDNVEIGDGATVSQSILADGCIIKAGATIQRGCIVGAGCIVGEGVVLAEFSRITLKKEEEDDFDDDWDDDEDEEDESSDSNEEKQEEMESDIAVVGPDGKGRLWQAPPEEEEELYGLTTEELTKSQSPGYDPSNVFAKRKALQVEDGDDFSEKEDDHGELDALSSDFDGVEFGTDDPYGRQKDVDVVGELKAICLEYESSSPIENLAIELNSFKFSQNASYSDCTTAATLALLEKTNITTSMTDAKLVTEFKSFLEHWAPLLQKMSIGQEEEKAIVVAIETAATSGGEMGEKLSSGNAYRFLLQLLFDEDIVSEEAFLDWSSERKNEIATDASLPRVKLYMQESVQDFLEWLAESDDDDDDDDDSE